MNKPFYKSTGVMGSLAVIVSALVALAASLASLKGLEITSENQALIVSLVMTMCGGVASLIGRLKASDVAGSGFLLGEMASGTSLPGPLLESPAPQGLKPCEAGPGPGEGLYWLGAPRNEAPESEQCPACHGKFGAHFLNCPKAWPAPQKKTDAFPLDAYEVVGVAEKFRSQVPLTAEDLDAIKRFLKTVGGLPYFVKDQAGCPSKDPAEPMAEGQLVGGNG